MGQDRGRHAQLLNLDGIPLTGSIGTTLPALKRGLDQGRIGKVLIQAKRYKHTVGVSAVRDLFGTMQNEGASKGI